MFGITYANRYTPKIENMRLIKTRSIPILSIAGKLSMKVIIVFLRDRLLLKKKKILTILKDLMIVVCGPAEELLVEFIKMPKIVMNTITISKMFQLS